MISSEVQRTLVKSPPELWTELSDPASLARHLGALGEIRITRAEAEKRVDWEAERTTGSIVIKPSGWGTKVTLSVERELVLAEAEAEAAARPDAEAAAAEAIEAETRPVDQAEPAPDGGLDADGEAHGEMGPQAGPEPGAGVEAQAGVEAEVPAAHENEITAEAPAAPDTATSEPAMETVPATEPHRGFFARLFGRHRRSAEQQAADELSAPSASANYDAELITDGALSEPDPEPASRRPDSAIESLQARFAPEPLAEATPEPAAQTPEPRVAPDGHETPAEEPEADAVEPTVVEEPAVATAADLAAELEAAEEVAAEEVTAVLTAVLDCLGAAHHRPFSRA